jgi:hypothetical protein
MSEDIMTTDIEETMTDTIETLEVDAPEIETPALTIEDIGGMLAEQFPPAAPAEPFAGDDDATWHYWSEMDTAERGVPTEWVWERLRNKRDALLAACDWRVVADAPWDKTPWTAYREALRDLPDVTTDPRLAVWPVVDAA